MKYLISFFLIMTALSSQTLFDFKKDADMRNWWVINDSVMGGRSNSSFTLNKEGHGVFSGNVSLENNGGFSSVRYQLKTLDISEYSKISIRLKGDGNPYEFRLKPNRRDYYSYITQFKTTGEWQEIEINLSDMYPSYRGRELNRPNFSASSIEELVFLIGNKKPQSFELLIDKLELK